MMNRIVRYDALILVIVISAGIQVPIEAWEVAA